LVVPGETGAGTRDAPPDRAAEAPVSGLFHGPLTREQCVFYAAAIGNLAAAPVVWLLTLVFWPSAPLRPGSPLERRDWLRAAVLLVGFDLIMAGIAGIRARSPEFAAAVALTAGAGDRRAAFLGVTSRAKDGHVIVDRVWPGASADGRLLAGDEIISLGGTPVRSVAALQSLIASRRPGALEVELFRGGEARRVTVELREAPEYMRVGWEGTRSLRRGRLDDARQRFEKALELAPPGGRQPFAVVGLAQVLERSGMRDEAVELLDREAGEAAGEEKDEIVLARLGLALRGKEGPLAERLLEVLPGEREKAALRPSVLALNGRMGEALGAFLGRLRLGLPAGGLLLAVLALAAAPLLRGPRREGLWLFLATAGGLAAAALLGTAAEAAWGLLLHGDPFAAWLGALYSPLAAAGTVFESLAVLLVALLLHRFTPPRPPPPLGFGPGPRSLEAVVVGLFLLYGMSLRVGIAAMALGLLTGPDVHPLAQLASGDVRLALWLFPTVAVVGPLAEETFIRGFLHVRLRARLGPWPAVVVGAVLFGLLHPVSIHYVAATAGLGLVLGYLRERSGSLLPSILAHMSLNGLNWTLMELL